MESVIESLLQPIADEMGVDVLKVSLGGGGHSQLLRVVVDRTGGIDSDGLERISRALALQLDAEDLIAGAFRLEVTSPGLDWPLERAADFERHCDEWIKVHFIDGTSQEGRNLGPVEPEAVESEADDANAPLCFGLRIEAQKSRDNREIVVNMAEVSKVVRAINWKDISRKRRQ